MFVFGHLGIGAQLVRRWRQGLPLGAFYLGALLPDLIDKPLYYGLHLMTGVHGAELGLISGTRTFGHTAVFVVAITAIAYRWRKPFWAALAMGVASHLFIDHLWDAIYGPHWNAWPRVVGLMWPALGNDFPDYPFKNVGDHLERFTVSPSLVAEGVGLALLILQLRSYLASRRGRPKPAARRSRRRG